MTNPIIEIYTSEEYQKFRKDHPLAAQLRLDHYKREWLQFMEHLNEYKAYQQTVKTHNESTPGWGDGKIAASVPAVIVDWLKWKAELNGDKFDKKHLHAWIKKHPEWLCVEKSRM